jgi:hypothetical protein
MAGESSSVLGMWFTAVPSRVEGVALMSLPRSQEDLWDASRVNRGALSEGCGPTAEAGRRCVAPLGRSQCAPDVVRPEPRVVGVPRSIERRGV